MKDKRILITGANGLLGSNLARYFHECGMEVWCCYHAQEFAVQQGRSAKLDLESKKSIQSCIEQAKPDWVIHAGGMTEVDECERNPTRAKSINTEGSRLIAQETKKYGGKTILISTDSVFSGETGGYTENDQPNPINIYAQTKLEAERHVIDADHENLVLRVNHFGYGVFPKMKLAEWIINTLTQGDEVQGFRDIFFAPLYVVDLAELIDCSIQRSLRGLYHLNSKRKVSKFEFAKRIAEIFRFETKLVLKKNFDERQFLAARPKQTWLDTRKFWTDSSTKPKDWEQGVVRMHNQLKGDFLAQFKKMNIQIQQGDG